MRVFLAVELSEELRGRLGDLARELGHSLRGARWVSPENLHLTLRFVGETDEATAARISDGLRQPLGTIQPFVLAFAGLGAFPDARRPRVLWVGVPEPPQALFAAQARVERAVRDVGLPPEPRRYEPHLTLARFKHPERALASVLRTELAHRPIGTSIVSEIVCFESELGPRKASYRARARVPLGLGQGP